VKKDEVRIVEGTHPLLFLALVDKGLRRGCFCKCGN
jgi:hypothetical protein